MCAEGGWESFIPRAIRPRTPVWGHSLQSKLYAVFQLFPWTILLISLSITTLHDFDIPASKQATVWGWKFQLYIAMWSAVLFCAAYLKGSQLNAFFRPRCQSWHAFTPSNQVSHMSQRTSEMLLVLLQCHLDSPLLDAPVHLLPISRLEEFEVWGIDLEMASYPYSPALSVPFPFCNGHFQLLQLIAQAKPIVCTTNQNICGGMALGATESVHKLMLLQTCSSARRTNLRHGSRRSLWTAV